MAYITSHDHPTNAVANPLAARLAAWRRGFDTFRHKRAIYLRTLRELRSYRPRELHDLKIDPADFEAVARQQAGW